MVSFFFYVHIQLIFRYKKCAVGVIIKIVFKLILFYGGSKNNGKQKGFPT